MRPKRSGRSGLLGLALLAGLFSARACEDPQKGSGGAAPDSPTPRPWFHVAPPPEEFDPPDSDGNPATASSQAIEGSVTLDGVAGPVEVLLLGDEGEVAVTPAGADGSFRFDVPPGGVRAITAIAAGRPVAVADPTPGAVRLAIGEAVPLAGRLVDADGHPAPGVRVAARLRDAAGRVIAASRPACTDVQGSFALPDAPAGELELLADAGGSVRFLASAAARAGEPRRGAILIVLSPLAGDAPLAGCEPPRSRPESAGGTIAFP